MCFFCPFSILITLLGEEGAGLCAYRAFVLAMHTLICVTFSFPPGVGGGWLRLLLVALPGLSVYLFAGRICHFVGFNMRRLICWMPKAR